MAVRNARPIKQNIRESQGTHIKELILLVADLTNESTQSAGTFTMLVTSPSARLRVGFELFWEPQFPAPFTIDPDWIWSLTAYAKGVNTQRQPLHEIAGEQGVFLPRSYEMDTSVKLVQIEAELSRPDAGNIHGYWYLRAYFEPNVQTIDADELTELFGMCAIELVGVP